MAWRNREGQETEQRFKELEETLGIQNLKDVALLDEGGNKYLVVYTDTTKYRTQLTEF